MRPLLAACTVNDHYPGIGVCTFELARALASLTDPDRRACGLARAARFTWEHAARVPGER